MKNISENENPRYTVIRKLIRKKTINGKVEREIIEENKTLTNDLSEYKNGDKSQDSILPDSNEIVFKLIKTEKGEKKVKVNVIRKFIKFDEDSKKDAVLQEVGEQFSDYDDVEKGCKLTEKINSENVNLKENIIRFTPFYGVNHAFVAYLLHWDSCISFVYQDLNTEQFDDIDPNTMIRINYSANKKKEFGFTTVITQEWFLHFQNVLLNKKTDLNQLTIPNRYDLLKDLKSAIPFGLKNYNSETPTVYDKWTIFQFPLSITDFEETLKGMNWVKMQTGHPNNFVKEYRIPFSNETMLEVHTGECILIFRWLAERINIKAEKDAMNYLSPVILRQTLPVNESPQEIMVSIPSECLSIKTRIYGILERKLDHLDIKIKLREKNDKIKSPYISFLSNDYTILMYSVNVAINVIEDYIDFNKIYPLEDAFKLNNWFIFKNVYERSTPQKVFKNLDVTVLGFKHIKPKNIDSRFYSDLYDKYEIIWNKCKAKKYYQTPNATTVSIELPEPLVHKLFNHLGLLHKVSRASLTNLVIKHASSAEISKLLNYIEDNAYRYIGKYLNFIQISPINFTYITMDIPENKLNLTYQKYPLHSFELTGLIETISDILTSPAFLDIHCVGSGNTSQIKINDKDSITFYNKSNKYLDQLQKILYIRIGQMKDTEVCSDKYYINLTVNNYCILLAWQIKREAELIYKNKLTQGTNVVFEPSSNVFEHDAGTAAWITNDDYEYLHFKANQLIKATGDYLEVKRIVENHVQSGKNRHMQTTLKQKKHCIVYFEAENGVKLLLAKDWVDCFVQIHHNTFAYGVFHRFWSTRRVTLFVPSRHYPNINFTQELFSHPYVTALLRDTSEVGITVGTLGKHYSSREFMLNVNPNRICTHITLYSLNRHYLLRVLLKLKNILVEIIKDECRHIQYRKIHINEEDLKSNLLPVLTFKNGLLLDAICLNFGCNILIRAPKYDTWFPDDAPHIFIESNSEYNADEAFFHMLEIIADIRLNSGIGKKQIIPKLKFQCDVKLWESIPYDLIEDVLGPNHLNIRRIQKVTGTQILAGHSNGYLLIRGSAMDIVNSARDYILSFANRLHCYYKTQIMETSYIIDDLITFHEIDESSKKKSSAS